METLNYLTVQDVLWINLQVTKKVQHFNFARLEEATFYQYAYGESRTLLPQAARFMAGFMRMHPFDSGNEATTFVGLVAFLKINGSNLSLNDDQALPWILGGPYDSSTLGKSVSAGQIPLGVRAAIDAALDAFPCTILNLVGPPDDK